MDDVDINAVKSLLKYEAETGLFTYVKDRGRQRKAGDVAGRVTKQSNCSGGGYRFITIRANGVRHEIHAHRLAWFYVHEVWPADQLDHINGNRDDNRLANLREATASQNGANRGAQRNNTSSVKGVSFHKASGKWRADLQVNKVALSLGLYETRAAAAAAYELAEYMYCGEFSRPHLPKLLSLN